MKTWFSGAALLALSIAPCAARAEVAFDSTRVAGETLWWYGGMQSQEEGIVVDLAGKDRKLDSLVLHQFMTATGGEFDVTASIYRAPKAIKDGDALKGKPLWTVTVHQSLAKGPGLHSCDITFKGRSIRLPDKVVVDFSFKAKEGSAAISLRTYDPNGNPTYGPEIGKFGAWATYEGMSSAPNKTSWTDYKPGSKMLYAAMTLHTRR